MANQFSKEFKAEAIKMVLEGQKSQNQIAQDLGIAPTTLSTWMRRYRANSGRGIEGSQVQSEAEIELRKLRQRNRELEEENAILKKAAAYFAKNQK